MLDSKSSWNCKTQVVETASMILFNLFIAVTAGATEHWYRVFPHQIFSFTLHAEGSVIQIDAALYKTSSQTFHELNISQIPMKAMKFPQGQVTWPSLGLTVTSQMILAF